MDFKELVRIFITGVILGNGPCLLYCLPIILPIILTTSRKGEFIRTTECNDKRRGEFIHAERRGEFIISDELDKSASTHFREGAGHSGWYTGLKLSLVFSISRLIAYSLLGFLSVIVFRFVSGLMGGQGMYFRFALGIFILAIGILYILGKELNPVCTILNRYIAEKPTRNLFLIGLLIGLSPCAPLAAVLTYVAAMSPNSLVGLLLGFAFGLGTVISIIIPVGTFAGYISQQLKTLPTIFKSVRLVSGVVLIYLALRLINFV